MASNALAKARRTRRRIAFPPVFPFGSRVRGAGQGRQFAAARSPTAARRRVAQEPGSVAGRRVLEFGAGRETMAIDKRVTSAAQALADVADGARGFITGFGGAGFPNVLIRALRESGRRNLTLIVNSATHRYSLTHELIEAGLVRKVVCSAARGQGKDLSPFETLWKADKIELTCLPQGTFAECIRAGGAGIPAFYTPVG